MEFQPTTAAQTANSASLELREEPTVPGERMAQSQGEPKKKEINKNRNKEDEE